MAFSYDLLADDLIAIDELLVMPSDETASSSLGSSKGCRGFEVSLNAVRSDVDLGSDVLLLKLGVLVEIGSDDPPRLAGNLSSRFGGTVGVKLDEVAFASGGKALLGSPVLGAPVLVVGKPVFAEGKPVPDVGKPVGDVNNGAGCKDALAELGNDDEFVFDSNPFELPKGDEPDEFDEKPFGGVLLNISKPFRAFPGLLEAIGPGPDTSGMV